MTVCKLSMLSGKSRWWGTALLSGLLLAAVSNTASAIEQDVVPPSKLEIFNDTWPGAAGDAASVDTGIVIIDGKVWVWGFRGSGQGGNGSHSETAKPPTPVSSLDNIVRVAGGIYHILALDASGTLYGWAQSGYGETGCGGAVYPNVPCKVLENVVYMDAGEYCSMALTEDGKVYTWGHNLYGQTGLGKGTGNKKTPQLLSGFLNNEKARLIGSAYEGGFAVTVDSAGKSKVWGWGDNEAGGLGIPTNRGYMQQEIMYTPVHIANLDRYADQIVYISGGNGWGEALLNNGTVIGWGLRASLGQGIRSTKEFSASPVVVMTGVERLFARYVGSAALTSNKSLYTWGQVGGSAFPMIYSEWPTKQITNGTPVSVGGGKEHVHYVTSEGKMYGVGYNAAGQTGMTSSRPIDWPGAEIPIAQWAEQQ